MVKQVVKFSTELEIAALSDAGDFGEIQVDVLRTISKEYASPSGAEGAEGLHLKCRFVDPVVRAGIVWIGITHTIRAATRKKRNARQARIAVVADRQRHSVRKNDDRAHPPSANQLVRKALVVQESLPRPERQLHRPTERESVTNVESAKPSFSGGVVLVLGHERINHRAAAGVELRSLIDAFRPGVAGEESVAV